MKLLNGDCLDLLKTIPDNSVNLIFSDLPYGQTANHWDSIIPMDSLWDQYKRIGKENCCYLFTAKSQFLVDVIISNREWYRYEWIWNKNKGANFAHCNKRPLITHEFVLVFYQKLPIYNPQMVEGKPYKQKRKEESINGIAPNMNRGWKTESDGMRYPKSIIEVEGHAQRHVVHPTQKPIALLEYLIKTYTNECDVVLDPTMGSGTTGIACKKLNRNFIGIEKDENYFSIAEKRINDFVVESSLEKFF